MTAVALIRVRAGEFASDVSTYAAVRSAEIAASFKDGFEIGDVARLPWAVLPGIRALAAAELRNQPPRAVAILGTTEGRAWATWHLPVEPPPVPA